MEIPPLLPLDASTTGVGAASLSPGAGSPAAAVAAPAWEAAAPAGPAAPLADQVHIHPLDVMGALQILIAEVRADLSLPGDVPHIEFAVPAAPQMLVQMLLQAVPPIQTQPPVEWLAAAMQVEAVLVGALDRGVDAVTAWHEVTPSVVEAAQEVRAVFAAATSDDPPNPQWLRPEWLGLAPVIQRYWRRRRYARRVLSDPDYSGRGWEGFIDLDAGAEIESRPAEKLSS